jgi:hypothetical protein
LYYIVCGVISPLSRAHKLDNESSVPAEEFPFLVHLTQFSNITSHFYATWADNWVVWLIYLKPPKKNKRREVILFWRMASCGMWRRVDIVWTDVSEDFIASIFRVEKSASKKLAWAGGCSPHPPAHANFLLADFSALKVEAIHSSETPVHTRTTRCHIPEYSIFHSHCCENLKSYMLHFSSTMTLFTIKKYNNFSELE